MPILSCLYSFLFGFFINSSDTSISGLFSNWNKMDLVALNEGANLAVGEKERIYYTTRLEDCLEDLNKHAMGSDTNSLRWQFLQQIKTEFNWKGKNWSVIEVTKTGEIKRFLYYLIYYEGNRANITVFQYYDKLKKIKEWKEHGKKEQLIRGDNKIPMDNGCNSGDIVVTDFKSAHPTKMAYYAAYTLTRESWVNRLISK